jgi:hypothetical protein
VALQRLFFLNNDSVRKAASSLADRLSDAPSSEAKVKKAFEIVYQRDPSAEEMTLSLGLLQDGSAESASGSAAASVVNRAANVSAKPAPMRTDTEASAGSPNAPTEAAKGRREKKGESPLQALCWALLSSNEFLFLQ